MLYRAAFLQTIKKINLQRESRCDTSKRISSNAMRTLNLTQYIFVKRGSELEERALDDPEAKKRLQTMPLFKVSAPFIRDFPCRNRLALRRPSLKRRCHVNKETVAAFISRVGDLLDHVPTERILNLTK
jgi:hypothetical protein